MDIEDAATGEVEDLREQIAAYEEIMQRTTKACEKAAALQAEAGRTVDMLLGTIADLQVRLAERDAEVLRLGDLLEDCTAEMQNATIVIDQLHAAADRLSKRLAVYEERD